MNEKEVKALLTALAKAEKREAAKSNGQGAFATPLLPSFAGGVETEPEVQVPVPAKPASGVT